MASRKQQSTRARPKKSAFASYEKEDRDRISPAKVVSRLRGWILAGYSSIELRHLTENGTTRVRRWPLIGEGGAESADIVASEVTTEAREDAEGLGGGFQRYAVYAYESEDPSQQHAARVVFEVRHDGGAEDDAGPSESATPTGILAQTQRHLETIMRTTAHMFGDVVAIQAQTINKQQERLAMYEQKSFEQFELVESLASAEHVRKLEEAKEARMAKAFDKGVELLGVAVPVALNRVFGAKRLPPAPPTGEQILKDLLARLTSQKDKLEKLAAAMGPEDMAILAELHMTLTSGTGEPKITEEIIKQFLTRVDQPKMIRIFGIFDATEAGLFAKLLEAYAEKEKPQSPRESESEGVSP